MPPSHKRAGGSQALELVLAWIMSNIGGQDLDASCAEAEESRYATENTHLRIAADQSSVTKRDQYANVGSDHKPKFLQSTNFL